MAAYYRVYDSCHLQADCQEPGSAPKPYARQLSTGYLYPFFTSLRPILFICLIFLIAECSFAVDRVVVKDSYYSC